MEKKAFLLSVVLLIVVILGSIYYYITTTQEGIPMEVNSIGNRMSDYFAGVGLAFYDGHDYNDDNNYNDVNHPLNKYMPQVVKFDPELQSELKKSLSPQAIDVVRDYKGKTASWVVVNDDVYQFWKIMKPTVKKMLSDLFDKLEMNKNVKWPIIHYRCSDVPFWRMRHYHVQRFQYYKDTLNEIKNKGVNIKKITIMYNSSHQSGNENKEACDNYIDMLREYLSSMDIETEINSETNVEDFAQLFYAPAVISTGGSFSFMSAFFGDGIFITAPSEPIKNCDKNCDFIKKEYNIEHEDVISYHDIDEMKGHFLREKFHAAHR